MQVIMVCIVVIRAKHYPKNVTGVVANRTKKGPQRTRIVPVLLDRYNPAVCEFEAGNVPGIGKGMFAHSA
jgi:hypothetical protein